MNALLVYLTFLIGKNEHMILKKIIIRYKPLYMHYFKLKLIDEFSNTLKITELTVK